MLPKYKTIAQSLAQAIQEGVYPPDSPIPSENQLQEDYQASRYTIRQAIDLLVQWGLVVKRKGAGTYVIESNKQGLSEEKASKRVGVITTYLTDYIFPSIIRGLEETLRKGGYQLLLACTNNDPAQEEACLANMLQQEVDALIIEPSQSGDRIPNLSYFAQLQAKHIPVLTINSSYDVLPFASVMMDDEAASQLATQHLLDKGHSKLAFITKIDDRQGRLRLKGFIKAFAQGQGQFHNEAVFEYDQTNRDQILDQAADYLARHPEVTGLVTYNDAIAMAMMNRLKDRGISVPGQVSLVSFDHSQLSLLSQPKISSIEHPKEVLGRDAALKIIEALESGQSLESILYPPVLIEGDSVRDLREQAYED